MGAEGHAPAVQERYARALETLVGKLREDPYVLAAVLFGSLAHDVVWEKSDIDLLLVTQEVRRKPGGLCLVEDGVNIHTVLSTRSEFRKMLEGSIQSSFTHSMLSKGRMLFCRDETLAEMFEDRRHMGARDRQIQLLRWGAGVLPAVAKAEKWLHVRGDPHYAFLWIMKAVDGLAAIEVLLHGEIVEREVVQQALRHNPAFFEAIYTGLMEGPKTLEAVAEALEAIAAYLRRHADTLFGPILEHLAEVGGVRSTTELNHFFSNQMGIPGLDSAYEWLADIDLIAQIGTPVHLTEKSRVDVQEAAYFCERPEEAPA